MDNDPNNDPVTRPSYYTKGKIEVIDFIIDQGLRFFEATILQYICRWRHKNGLEDLKKARWYLDKLIEVVEKHGKDKV